MEGCTKSVWNIERKNTGFKHFVENLAFYGIFSWFFRLEIWIGRMGKFLFSVNEILDFGFLLVFQKFRQYFKLMQWTNNRLPLPLSQIYKDSLKVLTFRFFLIFDGIKLSTFSFEYFAEYSHFDSFVTVLVESRRFWQYPTNFQYTRS